MENRIRPLKSIRTKEEYDEYKNSLERYLTEYKWYTCTKPTPTAQVLEHKAECFDENEMTAKHALQSRAVLVQNGEYLNVLKQNITAYLLAITEFDAKEENISFLDVVRGLTKKKKNREEYQKVIAYLERRFVKPRAERAGFVTTSVQNPGILSPVDCIKETIKECDFVNLDVEAVLKREVQTALVPVNVQQQKLFDQIGSLVDDYLEKNLAINKMPSASEKDAQEKTSFPKRELNQAPTMEKGAEIASNEKTYEEGRGE